MPILVQMTGSCHHQKVLPTPLEWPGVLAVASHVVHFFPTAASAWSRWITRTS